MTDVTALSQRMDRLELANDQVKLNVREEITKINADMRTVTAEIPNMINNRVGEAISKMEARDSEARK